MITLLVLAALTALALLWPLLRRSGALDASDAAVAVFKDQLAELAREEERGAIGHEEAMAARREIERRLLRATSTGSTELRQTGLGRIAVMGSAVAAPLLAMFLYNELGAPGLPDQPHAAREQQPGDPAMPDIGAMVARLEERLKTQPQDQDGWLMLARSRRVLGDIPGAVEASGKALALSPDNARIAGDHLENVVAAAEGIVTPAAKALLPKLGPDDPRTAYYTGLGTAQAGDVAGALATWERLIAKAPADAPWRPQVVGMIERTAREAGIDPAPIIARAPGTAASAPAAQAAAPPIDAQASSEAARIAGLPPAERQAAIRSMVDGLQAKLEAGQGDVEGWRRLARARWNLGETEAARSALAKATELKPDDAALLVEYGAVLVDPPTAENELPRVTDNAQKVFERAALLQPGDPEPWWYLGIRALQEGKMATARAHWQHVLSLLPADHPDRPAITARIAAIQG